MRETLTAIFWLVLGAVGFWQIWKRDVRYRGFDGKSELFALIFAAVVMGPVVFIVGLSMPKRL
jgi:hypothetical protein